MHHKPSHQGGGARTGPNPHKPKKQRSPQGTRRSVHEKSCGIIVYRRTAEGLKFLLLHYPGGHWDFPKGHVEKKDADEKATARRELQEETGIIQVDFNPGYREAMYYEFNRGYKARVKKVVVYFLAETKEEAVAISFEHQNFVWLPYEEALSRLTYENAKELIRKAQPYLSHDF
ncbi:NUDIX domain-containing protein [Candidatus Peregrinibacteria bacterium]|nr:MAG: NUDIX domain-containing protein [Candidatus Peregrinibacteria bacterium]